jgi:CO/xanthine dehydrogenase Mo-binding subunit/aerobic-type carbon monoxide dehydrogenase small subunit (CoxS/CutS family)
MVNKMSIDLTVNNRAIKAKVPPDLSLMRFLREELGLTGAKNGCDSGHCGTCTVILNGKPMRSCIVKMKMPIMAGCEVETIENLSRDGKLHPLQSAFMIEDAVQCGFCTPGMIMAAKALLDVNPDPSDDELREALRNNLCRCTGYVSILDAVHKAARMLASGIKIIDPPKSNIKEDKVIGVSVIRKDSLPKVTGETKYADDLYEDDMLVGKVLWSAHPHAEIRRIDTSLAERMPGVRLVLTSKDVPGENRIGQMRRDQPALAEKKVRFIGDPVAVVFSETEKEATEALKEIVVEYLPLPGVFSIEEAMASDAPLIHETGNLCQESQLEGGDIKKAFSEAAVIIEQTYTTPFIETAFLEPEAGVAHPTEDGGVIIKIGSQTVVNNRDQLADALALPLEKVRVVHIPVGGAFGGKEEIVLHFFLALGALRSNRPVKMTLSRPESMRVHTKRHAAKMHYKTAASADGKLLAVDAYICADTGAYSSTGPDVIMRMVAFGTGPYYVPNFRLRGEVYFTNNTLAGSMRGFGAPQVTFAMESQMDAMAHSLGLDPFDFRRRNALDVGLPLASGDILESSVGIKETIDAAEAALHQMTIPGNDDGKIGIGVASGMMNIGFGLGDVEEAGAVVELTEEGSIIVRVGLAELGQGGLTVMAQIAAQELNFPYEKIDVIGADTELSPPAGGTAASRQTYLSGNAVIASCRKLKEKIKLFAEEELRVPNHLLEIRNGRLINTFSGQVFELDTLRTTLKAEERFRAQETEPFANSAKETGDQNSSMRRTHFTYAYATDVAVVRVEESTGEVKVLKLITAQDVGRAINPKAVEGQFIGGAVMGMGYGLSEEFAVEQGINITNTLRKCRISTIEDMPDFVPIIVEAPEPHGPFGAKGVGETSLIPAAPAITNAIYNAIGARITSLPATKEKILNAIRETRME